MLSLMGQESVRQLRDKPHVFDRENVNESFPTMRDYCHHFASVRTLVCSLTETMDKI